MSTTNTFSSHLNLHTIHLQKPGEKRVRSSLLLKLKIATNKILTRTNLHQMQTAIFQEHRQLSMKREVKQKRKIHENQQYVLPRSAIPTYCKLTEISLFQIVNSCYLEFMYAV